jgi:flagellar FliJ protein
VARRFQFRLETVLRLRREREQAQQRVVAERVRLLSAAQGRLRAAGDQLIDAVAAARGDRGVGRLDVTQIARQRFWIGHLQRIVMEEEQSSHEIAHRLVAERRRLTELARDRRAIEKLRERQERRHRDEFARVERIELDEVATIAWRRGLDAERASA